MKLFNYLILSSLLFLSASCKKTATTEVKLSPKDSKEINDTIPKQQVPVESSLYYDINNDNTTPLDTKTFKIQLENYHSDNEYKIIFKNDVFSVLALFSYYEFGNYDEYIVTLDHQNKAISKLLVSYNTAPDGNMEQYEYSNFHLFKKTLDIEVFKVTVVEDLKTNRIVKKDSIKTSYKINAEGVIEKKT